MKVEDIKNKIEKATIAVATVNSKGKPHNIAVMYAKVKDGMVVITANYMKTTINNIKDNRNISLVFWEGERGWRIDGEAEYHDSGDWLEFIKSIPENKDEPCKGAIIINVDGVSELG